jgi:hypothetical protein
VYIKALARSRASTGIRGSGTFGSGTGRQLFFLGRPIAQPFWLRQINDIESKIKSRKKMCISIRWFEIYTYSTTWLSSQQELIDNSIWKNKIETKPASTSKPGTERDFRFWPLMWWINSRRQNLTHLRGPQNWLFNKGDYFGSGEDVQSSWDGFFS